MEISTWKAGKNVVVAVKGRLDTTAAPQFDQALTGWLSDNESRFVIDLNELEYISSSGLRSILALAKKVKARNGEVALTSLRALVKEVFDISGFSTLMPVYASTDDALNAMK